MYKSTRYLGSVPCASLVARLRTLDDKIWEEDKQRQIEYRNVHAQTQSILLIFCDGWPEMQLVYRSGWATLGEEVAGVMRSIVAAHYLPGGRVIRAMIARLPPGGHIQRHRDTHPSFTISHRIHVPLQTNADVAFIVGSVAIQAQVGVAFEINNLDAHEVHNRGTTDRIHLIFDYAPP